MNYQTKKRAPCAFITKDKQRLKQNGQNVYLKNGEQFEIELFNPLQTTVLAKIQIDGTYISGGGLVIKPGQRVFLERYLDDARKFKFETYQVDEKSDEVLNAIVNNGVVIVEFYTETRNPIKVTNINFYPSFWGNGFNGSKTNDYYYHTPTLTTNVSNLASFTTTSNNISYFNDSLGFETGRVEKGEESKQDFVNVNKEFSSWVVATSIWKILPESEKPYDAKDLKMYCGNCGTKRKKDSYNFCPQCGNQFKREKTEIIYTLKVDYFYQGKHYIMSTYNDTLDKFLEKNKGKIIVIKSDSLTTTSFRAIVID